MLDFLAVPSFSNFIIISLINKEMEVVKYDSLSFLNFEFISVSLIRIKVVAFYYFSWKTYPKNILSVEHSLKFNLLQKSSISKLKIQNYFRALPLPVVVPKKAFFF